MKLMYTLATVALMGLAATSNVVAADADGKVGGPVADACRQDLQTLCPDIKPGDGRIKACIRKNHASLSDGCKEAIKAQRKGAK